MAKPVKNNFARWIEGRVPPGLDWRMERSWVVWGLILGTLRAFRRVDRAAGWLLLPYLLWVSFAAYLNAGVWLLNR